MAALGGDRRGGGVDSDTLRFKSRYLSLGTELIIDNT